MMISQNKETIKSASKELKEFISSNEKTVEVFQLTGLRRALYGESSNKRVLDASYSPFFHGRFGSKFSHILFSSFKTRGFLSFSIVVNLVVVQCD